MDIVDPALVRIVALMAYGFNERRPAHKQANALAARLLIARFVRGSRR